MTIVEIEELVSSRTPPTFFHSLSVLPIDILSAQSVGKLNFELGAGDLNDTMYISNVNEVACTNETCNKRISNVGQEWSAGRPDNRPIGASDATRNSETCLGPFATYSYVQPHHTGYNTYDSRQASSRQPQPEDHDNTS